MTNKYLYKGSEWDMELIESLWKHIEDIGRNTFGFDPYEAQIEIISSEQMLDAYSSVAMPILYCVSGDTEYLTPTGWKRIKEYKEGELVAQYNENGTISFVRPLKFIESGEKELVELKNSRTEQKVTWDHDLVLKGTRQDRLTYGRIKKIKASEYVYNQEWGVITTFEHFGKGLGLDKFQIQLLVAFKADGSIVSDKVQRFGLKKNRKIKRLKKLLEINNIEYTENVHLDGLHSFRTKIPFIDSKRYVWNYEDLNIYDARIIFDEVFHWDGCECYQEDKVHLSFSSKYKEDVDFLQFVGALNGYRSSVKKYDCQRAYQVYFSQENVPSLGGVKGVTKENAYCFTVPSHMWVSRLNGKISVTGNCHWSFGKTFIQNERQYQKGMQGLAYEVVINTNPCIAYLMENNTATLQALVLAHASVGHSHFFKNNYLFKGWTDADTIIDYLKFAKNYIKSCEEKYGEKEVEYLLDACHSLQNHGIDKYKKSPKLSSDLEYNRKKEWNNYFENTFNDLWRTIPKQTKLESTIDDHSISEENILYFIEKHSPILKDWQREIVRIVRKISQYFYPQRQTQLMNEGFATFTHHLIMTEMHDQGLLTDGAYLEFLQSHSNVVTQLGWDNKYYSGINVYALGFAMFQDIKRICEHPDEEDLKWFPDIANTDWLTTIKDIAANYRDESFVLQFLSPKVARHFKLFSVNVNEKKDHVLVNATHDDDSFLRVRKTLAEQYDLSRSIPQIEVVHVDWDSDRWLYLEHKTKNNQRLNYYEMRETVAYVHQLWGFAVKMDYVDLDGNLLEDV